LSDPRATLLVRTLRDPQTLTGLSSQQWETLIRQARSSNLLARLAAMAEELGLLSRVPAAPRAHLEAARLVSQAHAEAVRREVVQVRKALAPTGVQIILLKGAAYLYGGLRAARGRLFSDIDILVPGAALTEVESALMRHGWATTHHNAYDQRYYRRWMHELPPLRHVSRLSVVDVHHAILPPTARLKPDSAKLRASSRPLDGEARLRLLAPADMVLHSAAHLFFNEELGSGLRDLVDLDSLLRDFGREPRFWDEISARAVELDLARPLYYALRYCIRILDTPVPGEARRAGERARPPLGMTSLMDALFLRAFQPRHAERADLFAPLARQSLYIRGHWLRMPVWLLARHLTVKALARRQEEASPGR
jgi:hypothetical protein